MAALARASPSGPGLVLDQEPVLGLDREPAPRRESGSCSALMRHKLEAGVGLSSFFPPEEVRKCRLYKLPVRANLVRETWSLPCFSCERMPLLFLSKE